MAKSRAISSAGVAIIAGTVIVIIVIGLLAALPHFGNGSTHITCSESPETFSVPQNSTTSYLTYWIPADPCQGHISLGNFSLNVNSGTGQASLSGNVHVDSRSQLKGMIVYLNGSYETYSAISPVGTIGYTLQYDTILQDQIVPIVAGTIYTLEFVAIFKDGTATEASISLTAT